MAKKPSQIQLPLSQSFTMRLKYPNRVGMFARIVGAIGKHGGDLGGVDIVSTEGATMVRDVTVRSRSREHGAEIIRAVQRLPGVELVNVSDRVFLLHLGGKIAIHNKVAVNTRDTLSQVYTPGVARVSEAIAENPRKAWQLTIKGNAVAVVTDGSAVLGLGNIGPEAALPVMEGKAMLFKEFADIDAYPICLDTQETEAIVRTVAHLAPGFGGINLEDIAAPRCFEIEAALQKRLDIPVFHDDQHGTAIVVLAALLNALRCLRRKLSSQRIVILGAGAAGTAIARMLQSAGARDVVVCDRHGALEPGRKDLNPTKQALAASTNPRRVGGPLGKAIEGAQVFIGVSGPGLVTTRMLRRMAPRPVVFALANPTPEIMPEEAAKVAAIVATGRSDYPNQINNVLAFPGVFRGALNVRARRINEAMQLAAARAIAESIPPRQLSAEYIVPSVFNREVVVAVSRAVEQAAIETGVARRRPRPAG